jgi:hypothetical protein
MLRQKARCHVLAPRLDAHPVRLKPRKEECGGRRKHHVNFRRILEGGATIDVGDQSAALLGLVNGFKVSQAIHVAATLGIADLLKNGPRSSDDLAAVTGTHPRSLYRVLRALASIGVFREDADQRFALTPFGNCLRSDAPEPVGPLAVHIGEPGLWQA